jgi:hypothetical protein
MLGVVHAGALAVGLLSAPQAMAAGGHFAVDDANILEAGNCKVEGWLSSEDRGEKLAHAGTGCRVGPIELTGSVIYAREVAGDSATGYGLQGKWATPVGPGFSAGLLVANSWQAHDHPPWAGGTVSTLFTWTPVDDLAFHLNIGRDYVNRGRNMAHSGVAVEWSAKPGWLVVGERFVQLETQYLRAGLRWAANEALNVDFSRAYSLSGRFGSIWTIGASWQFEHK